MQMKDKKATEDDDVFGVYSKLFGEDGLGIMIQLINNTYETRKWPKYFTKVTMIALKKPKASKCSNHCTLSLIAHTAKIVMRVLRRRIEKKTENEISLELEDGKELVMKLGCCE
jgi:hypothetical protein